MRRIKKSLIWTRIFFLQQNHFFIMMVTLSEILVDWTGSMIDESSCWSESWWILNGREEEKYSSRLWLINHVSHEAWNCSFHGWQHDFTSNMKTFKLLPCNYCYKLESEWDSKPFPLHPRNFINLMDDYLHHHIDKFINCWVSLLHNKLSCLYTIILLLFQSLMRKLNHHDEDNVNENHVDDNDYHVNGKKTYSFPLFNSYLISNPQVYHDKIHDNPMLMISSHNWQLFIHINIHQFQ